MTAVAADPSTWSPRDRARRRASDGARNLARYLLVWGAFEATAVIIDASLEPATPPPWLVSLGLVLRAALPLGLVVFARALMPWARAIGLGAWAGGAQVLAVLASAASCVVLADVAAPAAFPSDVWEPLVRLVAASFHVGTLLLVIIVSARVAAREELQQTGRALAWSNATSVGALIAGLAVLEPALLPVWWLGPAAPLFALLALAMLRVITWERALWPVTFGVLFGVLLLVMGTSPELLAGLGALLGIAVATVMPRGPLFDIAMVLGEEPAAPPSRTFIRRLLDGPAESQIGSMSSRIGSQAGSNDEADNLALAYRELGIEPPRPSAGKSAPAELEPLGPMAKLEPRIEATTSPRWVRPGTTRETTAVPDAAIARAIDLADLAPWDRTATALHQVFRGFVGRACTLVFGFLLMRSPLARESWGQLAAFGVLALLGVIMTLGLFNVAKNLPSKGLLTPLWASTIAAATMTATDIVCGALVAFAPELALPVAVADSVLFLVTMSLLLYFLRSLYLHLGQPNVRGRIVILSFELLVFTALASIAVATGQSGESDMSWLAIPSAIASGLAGLAFFASFLWLVTDARTLIGDWQMRIRRSYDPDAREAGDPDPNAPIAAP